ncbi:MAG: prepilin-type N-terminal cleavage/methylation domain-containing protein [Planctomycetota bacterium]|jgi:prepilin-type N-terminal cleavage/methylation domain-containing protein
MQSNDMSNPGRRTAGFTLIELIVAISLVALLVGIVAPNLAGLLPTARLDGSAKDIKGKLTMIRSESRIQAKRMEMEFDLDSARFRTIYPPEEQLTSDQVVYNDAEALEENKDWIDLADGVVFAGAGDAKSGTITKGLYKVVFDEYGFSADQVIAVQLANDETMVWSVVLHGLTGHMEIVKSEMGELGQPTDVGEGAF